MCGPAESCDLWSKDKSDAREGPEGHQGSLAAQLAPINRIAASFGIDEVIPVKAELIAVSDWVNLKCKYGCQRFGKSWCCPPETPPPDKVRSILKEYRTALILSGNVKNPYFYRENQKKRRIQVGLWKGTVAVERALFLQGFYKAFSLISESCALCKECLYPQDCWFPQERRPSVEAFSIDIFETLRRIGREFRIYKDRLDLYRYYGIILLE